jgi:hypothetical protein
LSAVCFCFLGSFLYFSLLHAGPVVAQSVKEFVVRLQSSSPGVAQEGHANISGTVTAAKVEAHSNQTQTPAARFENSSTGRYVEITGSKGAISTNGFLMRDYGSGPMASLPAAYGRVVGANVVSGTGNFSVQGIESGVYRVTLQNIDLKNTDQVLVGVNYNQGYSARTCLVEIEEQQDSFLVRPFRANGDPSQGEFSFIVWKTSVD